MSGLEQKPGDKMYIVIEVKLTKRLKVKCVLHSQIFKKKFYWSIADLQCCVSFRCTAK